MENEHYYKQETEIPLKLGYVTLYYKEGEYKFLTSPPVFAWRRIDKGTLTLLDNLVLPEETKRVLEIGCGYGVLGITIALTNPNLDVTMVDISKRAIYLTKKNLKEFGLENDVNLIHGDLYESLENEKFDLILSNPPYSAGKSVVNQIIKGAAEHLNSDGLLEIVGRHNKGGKSYQDEISKHFKEVYNTGIHGGFRVYVGKSPIKKGETSVSTTKSF